MTSYVRTTIRTSLYGKEVRTYLYMTDKMITELFNLIEWDAIGWEMEISPDLYQTWALRQGNRFCFTVNMIKIGVVGLKKVPTTVQG